MADGAHRPIGASGIVRLRIDNTAPNLAIKQIRWRAQAWGRAFDARAGNGGGPATNWLTNDDYSYNAVDVRVAIINV